MTSKIFSGDSSREFWADINGIQYEEVKRALYHMGCKLQELEAQITRLSKMQKTGDNKTPAKKSGGKKFKASEKPVAKTGRDARLIKKG